VLLLRTDEGEAIPTGSFTALELTEAATLAPTEVLSHLASGLEGLSQTEVDCRVREFGANVLAIHRVRASVVLWRQLKNPILILLLGAALVSGLTGGEPTRSSSP